MANVEWRMPSDSPRRATWLQHLVRGSIVLLVFAVLCGAKLWRPGDVLTIRENIQIAEAQAWWGGRLDLPERKWDSALFEGRVYSHFPPMFSFISSLVVPYFDGFPHGLLVLLIVLPAPILAYGLFNRICGTANRGALIAIALICGTSAIPVLDKAVRGASPYPVNQILALDGLLIFLWEYVGRGRVAVLGLGLAIAAWSRQLSLAFAIPYLWSAWLRGEQIRFKRVGGALAVLGFIVAVPMILNMLKFGNPLDSGYMYLYNDRPEDAFSRDARTNGLFSPQFVPRNLYHANLGFPEVHRVRIEEQSQVFLQPNQMGTGIWWTTPLLLWLFLDFRKVLADPRSRMLLIAAALANFALLFYHSTGFEQRGFNRYSLDYLPALLALVAPGAIAGRRIWISSAMIAWSVFYFAVFIRWPHVRVW